MVSQPAKASTTGDSDAGYMSQERDTHAELALTVRRNLLANESAERIAKLFSVLSDPTRLQVLYALLNAPTGELCVGDLATSLDRDDTTISHQLRVLRYHRSEEHTSELQSQSNLVCRLLLENKRIHRISTPPKEPILARVASNIVINHSS